MLSSPPQHPVGRGGQIPDLQEPYFAHLVEQGGHPEQQLFGHQPRVQPGAVQGDPARQAGAL